MVRRRTSSSNSPAAHTSSPGRRGSRGSGSGHHEHLCVGSTIAEASRLLGVDSGGPRLLRRRDTRVLRGGRPAVRGRRERSGVVRRRCDPRAIRAATGTAQRRRHAAWRRSAVRSACASQSTACATSATGSRRIGWPTAVRHALLRGCRAGGPACPSRRRRGRRERVGRALRRPRAAPRRRSPPHVPDRQTARVAQQLLERSRSSGTRPTAEVPTIEPRIRLRAPRSRILLPGEPGFETRRVCPESIGFPGPPDRSRRG